MKENAFESSGCLARLQKPITSTIRLNEDNIKWANAKGAATPARKEKSLVISGVLMIDAVRIGMEITAKLTSVTKKPEIISAIYN